MVSQLQQHGWVFHNKGQPHILDLAFVNTVQKTKVEVPLRKYHKCECCEPQSEQNSSFLQEWLLSETSDSSLRNMEKFQFITTACHSNYI